MRYRGIDEGLLYKVGDTETFEDQSHTVLSESKGKIELKVLDRGA